MSETATIDRELLKGAHDALRAAVRGVAPQDWTLPTPCDQWNVTQVLQHAAGDQLAYVAAVVPTPLPQGALPGWLAAGACALDAAVHAWDIAVATGQDSPLTPAMARPLMAVASQIVEPLRGFAYAAALSGDDDDDTAALLRYLGRRPDWTR